MKACWMSDILGHEWESYKKKFDSKSELIEAMDDDDEE